MVHLFRIPINSDGTTTVMHRMPSSAVGQFKGLYLIFSVKYYVEYISCNVQIVSPMF